VVCLSGRADADILDRLRDLDNCNGGPRGG
jgi:hypothetical protein